MNRERMIQTAGEALKRSRSDIEDTREAARLALDAILPQVTTVEELTALPNGSLLDHHGSVFRWRSNMSLLFDLHSSGLDYEPSDILRNGPLTVVWTPS